MRTLTRSVLFVSCAGLLLASASIFAAESSRDRNSQDNPLRQCQKECKTHKDNEGYESCMLKCRDAHRSRNPAQTTTGR